MTKESAYSYVTDLRVFQTSCDPDATKRRMGPAKMAQIGGLISGVIDHEDTAAVRRYMQELTAVLPIH